MTVDGVLNMLSGSSASLGPELLSGSFSLATISATFIPFLTPVNLPVLTAGAQYLLSLGSS